METIDLSRRAADGDLVRAFREAVASRAPNAALRLVLEPGVYTLREDQCRRRFAALSNHDSAVRAVAFALGGRNGVLFDGGGSLLLCEGRLIPFWIEGCADVRLRNFALDWVRPFTSEAEVVEAPADDTVLVRLDPQIYPHAISEGRLVFTGPHGYQSSYLKNILEFETATEAVAAGARDTWAVRKHYEAAWAGNGLIRLRAAFAMRPRPGNRLALPHEHRTSPAIVVTGSSHVTVEDAALHHAGGMGVIAQMSRDLTLRRVVVAPRAGTGRLFSLAADASHFVECDGGLLLDQCRFRGQLDDSANIHGVYWKILERLDAHRLTVGAMHFQQEHVDYLAEGLTLRLIESRTLFRRAEILTIRSLHRLDPSRVEIQTVESLPSDLAGLAVAVDSRRVRSEVRRSVFEKHRARGLLLSAPGEHWVHANTFRVPGNAILSTCDCTDWFEAGALEKLTVEDNVFDQCASGDRPFPAAIRISPAIHEGAPDNPVQQNIRIHRNVFTGPAPALIVHRCRGVDFSRNVLSGPLSEAVLASACEATVIRE